MNPSRASWLRPRWLFNRRAMKAVKVLELGPGHTV